MEAEVGYRMSLLVSKRMKREHMGIKWMSRGEEGLKIGGYFRWFSWETSR